MKIGSISSTNTFKGANESASVSVPNKEKNVKEVIKDNKGKIALGLSALAAVGVAAVAISRGKKLPSELSLDDFKKIGKFNKGAATVKGKPFNGVINVTNQKGNYALEYADGVLKSSTFSGRVSGILDGEVPKFKKVYSEKDGTKVIQHFNRGYVLKADKNGQKVPSLGWVPTGEKTIISDSKVVKERMGITGDILRDVAEKQQDGSWKKTFQGFGLDGNRVVNENYAKRFIYTYDETGKVIGKKPTYFRRSPKGSNEQFVKQSKNYIDKNGNKVVETLKNGELYTRQTTKIADDGSKQIVVEYFDKGSRDYKKIINIAKDGTKQISEIGTDSLVF